jgi:hypothetical protein
MQKIRPAREQPISIIWPLIDTPTLQGKYKYCISSKTKKMNIPFSSKIFTIDPGSRDSVSSL